MKILGIVGSPRKEGNTSNLVQEALKPFKEQGAITDLLYLGDHEIKGCHGCEGCQKTYKCVIEDDMQKIYPLILEADALILGSPTYFYSVTSDMKAFIDRCYCFEAFDADDRSVWMGIQEVLGPKYASVIAVCEQHNETDMGYTSDLMKGFLEALGYRVVGTVKALGFFNADEVSNSDVALRDARQAGEKLFKTLKLKDDLRTIFNGND